MNAKAATCPSDELLADYGLGKLDDGNIETIYQHLETCVDCRSVVAGLSGDSFVNRLREAEAQPSVADAPAQRVRTFAAGESISNAAESSATPPPASGQRELAGALPAGKSSDLSGLANVPQELANHPDYEFLKELGRGGMGIVYLARNRMMDRLEVLKVVSKSLLERPGALERFQQEIRSAAKLAHPNIVAAYTVLRPGDLLVFAMEYVDGQDLSQVVKQRGPLPVTNATSYVQQVALGLQHAHDKGMVHRDIKPNNLMLAVVGKKHVVKILDFGLAKATSEKGDERGLTKSGQMMGTPDYIAPEQSLDAQKADIRADIYSLGCTLYYLLAGHTPFRGNSLYEILQAHHQTEARPLNLERPEVPAELAAIVSKMMAKDPARRFQTPMEVAKALNPFFKGAAAAAAKLDPLLPPSVSIMPKPPAPAAAAAPAEPAARPVPLIAQPSRLATAQPVPVTPLPLNSLAGIEATASRPRTKARAKRPRIGIPVAIGLLLVGVIGLGAIMFKFRTADGVVAIEVNEPNPEVFVDGNRATVTWDAGGMQAEITLPPGSRKIELQKDGFKAVGETVELESRGRRVLVARLERNPPSPRAGEKPAASRPAASVTVTPPIAAALPSTSSGTADSAMIPPAAASDGFVPLFNGRDLTGWKTLPNQPNHWRVENGVLTGRGALSNLFTERSDFSNLHLRVDARINAAGNSGVSFRSPFVSQSLGVEAQITNVSTQRVKTGGIFAGGGGIGTGAAAAPPDQWFVLDIIAVGDHIVVRVNGKATTDILLHIDGSRTFATGHIALQQYEPNGLVEFRKIEIKELAPPTPVSTAASNTIDATTTPTPAATSDGFVPLFNGRDLTGWTQRDGPMKFEVQDGTIVGTALPKTPHGYLCTTRDYANFILQLEFKVDEGLNSGIQIRSQSLPGYKNGRVHGYQVDIVDSPGQFYTGAVYDEGRRGVFLDDLSKSPTARTALRKNAWNELRIECQGDSIKTLVNGWPAADCQDSLTSAGFIALQVHAIRGETPLQIRFRKIEIKELTLTKAVATRAKSTTSPVSSALDPFRSEIDRAQQVYSRAVGQADSRMKNAFTQVLGNLKSAKIDAEQRLKLIDAVTTEKAAFESLGRVPLSAPMHIALEEYLMSIKSAREAQAVPFDKAVALYTKRKDEDKTRECLAAKQRALNPRILAAFRFNPRSPRNNVFEDGMIKEPQTGRQGHWSIEGNQIVMRWDDARKYVDKCTFAMDGKTATGLNNLRQSIAIIFNKDP